MSSSPTPRPSSHRAGRPRRRGADSAGGAVAQLPALVRRAMPPLAAVTAVVGVIVVLLILNDRPSPSGPGPGAVAEKPASARITESPTPSPSASTTRAAPPAAEPPATQTPAAAAKLPVTVLNNSRIAHLASRVAADLRAHGWPVRKTGNFTGRLRMTTVYYAPGQHAAAVALARAFGQIRRVEPRFAGLPGHGLTLVVTRDWSS